VDFGIKVCKKCLMAIFKVNGYIGDTILVDFISADSNTV
jgi:hypothetical protein